MEQEYRLSTWWKFFYVFIGCFPLSGIFAFSGLVVSRPDMIAIIIPLIISFFFLVILLGGQLRKKVIISDDRVVGVNVIQTKELFVTDIKGCRISEKRIVIEPISASSSKIIINNYTDFTDGKDIKKWLAENFADLDVIDLEQDRESILNDTSLGATREEREAKIANAKLIAIIYSIAGLIIGLGGIPFINKQAIVIVLILYPILGLIIMGKSNGLIRFISNLKTSVYSFAAIGLFTPSFVLFSTGVIGYDIYQFSHIWFPASFVCVIATASIYYTGLNKKIPSIIGQSIGMLIVSAIYAFGSVVQVNCVFDKSTPQEYTAIVLDHRSESGKNAEHYLKLSPWGPRKKPEEVSVPRWLYYEVPISGKVKIRFKQGLLKIPWFTVSD